MARSNRRQNEDRLREMREQAFDAKLSEGPAWKTPRIGEWWALAPGNVIHIIARVNDKLRVTYVAPMCGGKPSQARVEITYNQLRDDISMLDFICTKCWEDPRALGISVVRYAEQTQFSPEEVERAVHNLETAA